MTEETIFAEALEKQSPAELLAFLDQACGGDVALRQRIEGLLKAHRQAGDFLERPVLEQSADETQAEQPALIPDDTLAFLEPSPKPGSRGRIGHYEVLEVLGQGGFGIVFRAFDEVLHRVVAVKVLSPQLAATSPARKRFLREARSSAAVRHENVVQVHETQEKPLPYLVMEFVPGETLQQRLDRTGPLDVAEVLRIGRQIAEGLAAAHATGLIHRDVKPANVLIDAGPQERVKLTDFGLARAADDASLSQSGVVAGTPLYMAPEQAKGETLDHRADLFSLGSVLYAVLTGRPPFRAETTLAVLKRVAEDTPRPMREVIPEVPEWLCRVVEKLHAKSAGERFQSAREVADVLADCEAQLRAHGSLKDFSRIPGGKPAPIRSRPNRLAILAGLLALAVMMSATVIFGPHVRRYLGGRGEVEITPEPGWVSVIVHKDGEAVSDWFDVKKSPTIELPPGKYKLEPGFAPGRTVERWEITTHGLFSGPVTWQGVWAPEIEIARGERVTVRAVMRDDPTTLPPSPNSSAHGWVQLFNGQDLTGWEPGRPGDRSYWEVRDGAIVGRGPAAHLYSRRGDFADFHLRVEIKVSADGDSGIWFRVPGGPGQPFEGYQVQVGDAKAELKTGSLTRITNRVSTNLKVIDVTLADPDTWFTCEVIANGPLLTLKVNGRELVQTRDHDHRAGHLVLEAFGDRTVVECRKIEIKELPGGQAAAPPLAVAPFDAAKAKEHQVAWAKHLGVEPEVTNVLGMKLRLIPPGEFTRGSSVEEIDRLVTQTPELKDAPDWVKDEVRSEGPELRVTIREPFLLGAYEVTVGQFREFVKATAYKTEAEKTDGGRIWDNEVRNWVQKPEYVWSNPTVSPTDAHPVVFITLADAEAFCDWLGKRDGRRYAIPTEDQWEYACRAGTTTRWFFGDDDGREQYGWTLPASGGKTRPVGRLQPNPFGLYDVCGNAGEVTTDGRGGLVVRGGTVGGLSILSRSASRYVPAENVTDFRRGFRVAVVGLGP